ncbi:WxcM-like domain-containing protein [uncultured Polaribacter sp.]|uniref:WxcM-like domain-containing protein n=1 Tax=uncultured Polaribacter sp. TaxID=174711 RepID=UPI00261243C0|nr:WxcM-like domain-containing protein [uncultured Polaribacter sp.]
MGKIVDLFQGIELTPLKIIKGEKGNVMHALKCTDVNFESFGESYFSTVVFNDVKGWKKHKRMVSNLIVPVGAVKFVFYDDREGSTTFGFFCEVILSITNYQRLTVQPGIWMAFQGASEDLNLLMNIASIPHDPLESIVDPVSSNNIIYNF